MTPTICREDVFFINPFDRNPNVGDIIIFQREDIWTVHRVVAITDEEYITKGDNNIATDQQSCNIPSVTQDKIGGTVVTASEKVLTIPKVRVP